MTFNLQRSARSLVRGLEQSLRMAGITAPQFHTLSLLSAHGEMSVGQIAERLGTDRTTMSRNLDLMLERGLVVQGKASDARMHPYRLTDAGRQRLSQALPAWVSYQRRVVGLLGEGTSRRLLTTVQKL